ncbi:histamine N-methyltransferase-like [Amphiura filiformis]|uniref:histamine N-methyltransferase-like n=1 Tax=Amphiura filiformis TaxID=82378 RepID=UPI003B2285BE
MSLPLTCNKDRWLEAYNMFLENSDRQQRVGEWIERQFESKVVNILSDRHSDDIGVKQPLCVLGIGSAEGNQDILQLKQLKSKFSQISATVVEPSRQMILQYQDTVHQKSRDFTGIEFEWYNQTYQDFIQLHGIKQKYHLISMVHSIYCVGDTDLEEALRELQDLLEPGGVILMVVLTDHTGVGKLVNTFPNLATKEQNSATNETSTTKSNRLVNSTDVKSILDKHKIAYTQSEYTEFTDITACFSEEDTITGNILLDGLTQTLDFKTSVSTDVYYKVMDFIKDNMSVRKNQHDSDKLCFDSVCDILMISK